MTVREKGAERQKQAREEKTLGPSRSNEETPCYPAVHKVHTRAFTCVHTALFTSNYMPALEAVGRHLRLPAALFLLYKCWKSSFIFFELAAFYCLHWRSAPTWFLLNWSKAHLRAEHRDKMYGLKSLRGLKGFRGRPGQRPPPDRNMIIVVDLEQTRKTASMKKKKNCYWHPLHPCFVLELKCSVCVCWCQTVTVTTKGIYLKMENEEHWCKKWTTNHFSWFQIFFPA